MWEIGTITVVVGAGCRSSNDYTLIFRDKSDNRTEAKNNNICSSEEKNIFRAVVRQSVIWLRMV